MTERITFTNQDYRKCPGFGTPECCGTCHQKKIDTVENESNVRIDYINQEKTSHIIPIAHVDEVYSDMGAWISIAKESQQVLTVSENLDNITQESIDRISACHSEVLITEMQEGCPVNI